MALAGTTTWEIRRLGSDLNGGGVDRTTVVVDYSVQASPQVAVTDVAATGTTTITSATAGFTSNMVGNNLYLAGGTGSLAGTRRVIKTFVSATSITVDAVVAIGTGITMNLGGALASIGQLGVASTAFAGGHQAFVFNDGTPYSITSATTNISGGCLSNALESLICGYTSNRTTNNTDTPPTIQYGTTGVSLFVTRGMVRNIIMDGNGQATSKPSGASDSTNFSRCGFLNMNTTNTAAGSFELCWCTGCSASVFVTQCFGCIGYANTATPFNAAVSILVNCLSVNNTGATTDGFNLALGNAQAANCTAYNNGRSGFFLVSNARSNACINCISEGNAAWGYDTGVPASASTGIVIQLLNCAAYGNVSGDKPTPSNYPPILTNFVSVTAGSVFTNAAGGDFSLNNTSGQGALLRAAGALGVFPTGVSTAGYQDIGAAQHPDTAPTGGQITGLSSIQF